MDGLNQLMEACNFTKPTDPGIYKPWKDYLSEALRFAIGKTRPREKKRALMIVGLYSLFIEYLAGRIPYTRDEMEDGGAYMSRAAKEFSEQFIRSMLAADDG